MTARDTVTGLGREHAPLETSDAGEPAAGETSRTPPDTVRVHDCLYSYCPKRWEECARCDAVVAILRRAALGEGRDK